MVILNRSVAIYVLLQIQVRHLVGNIANKPM